MVSGGVGIGPAASDAWRETAVPIAQKCDDPRLVECDPLLDLSNKR